jgi:hypothetical protein
VPTPFLVLLRRHCTVKRSEPRDLRSHSGVLLKTPVFWDVALSPWANSFRIFEGWLIPSLTGLTRQLNLKIKTLRPFKTSVISRPKTQHNTPQALYLQKEPNNSNDRFEEKLFIIILLYCPTESSYNLRDCVFSYYVYKGRHFKYKVTLRRVRVTTVSVEKQ